MIGQDASDAVILGAVSQIKADVVLLRPWKQLTPNDARRLWNR